MRTFSKTNLSGTRVSYHGATGIINNATQIDIASLRAASSIKSGLQNLLASNVANTTVTSNGVRISAPSNYPGTSGNNLSVATAQGSTLAHYNIDFGQYLSSNSDMTFPDDLYGKGFRVYCASDSEQWFNFTFTGNVIEVQDDKPILDNVPDVKNIFVDISEAKDAASLVQAIRDSAEPQLDAINHYIHVEANPAEGVLTIYDDRPFNPKNDQRIKEKEATEGKKYLQDQGAKIADGVLDYLGKTFTNIYEDVPVTYHRKRSIEKKAMSIVIHDNDRANRETRLRIPCTTLDQLFSFPEGEMTAEDFYVMTKESRDALLGKRGDDETADEKGYLDTAIDYLTDANTLLGAQRMRLELTYSNLTTQEETTTAPESTIRDADMAKEMTSFAKNNVLSQAAQSMLAQANQNASSVLGLLQ